MWLLNRDRNNSPVQAFPLINGQINITAGTVTNVNGACCVEDGAITLVGYSNISVSMVAGDVFAFDTQSVTVTSGKFHLA